MTVPAVAKLSIAMPRTVDTKMDNPKKGRPRKKPLPPEVEEDLIAENQRLKEQLEYLQMENDYLKKLDALVRKEAQQKGKKRR